MKNSARFRRPTLHFRVENYLEHDEASVVGGNFKPLHMGVGVAEHLTLKRHSRPDHSALIGQDSSTDDRFRGGALYTRRKARSSSKKISHSENNGS